MLAIEEAFAAATDFRAHHRLGAAPLGDLVTLIERATGIDVAVLNVQDSHEHGLTVRDPQREVMYLGVASTPHPMRQRSTLAHELAHLIFNDWASYDDDAWDQRSSGEIRADAFAGYLLIPREGLREYLGGRAVDNLAVLSEVVQWFMVSPQMALVALAEINLIDTAFKDSWWHYSTPQLAARYGWTDQYETLQLQSQKTRAPQKLLRRATAGFREGVISAQTIATLRGIDVEQAEQELHETGLAPITSEKPNDDVLLNVDLPGFTMDLSALDELDPDERHLQ